MFLGLRGRTGVFDTFINVRAVVPWLYAHGRRTRLNKDILRMAETTVSIRVIPFSGKFEDWPYWSVKLLTRARQKGYRDVLLGQEVTLSDVDKPADTASQVEIDKYTKARELNDLAFEEMCLCIDVTT
jgi:hypothetical protein